MAGLVWKGKDQGNVADILTVGIFILAMAIVMLSFMNNMALIQQKAEVGQLARKYILRMETMGGLREADRAALEQELQEQGVTEIQLEGTNYGEAGYGEPIALEIRGKLGGSYDFLEKRVSTAKY